MQLVQNENLNNFLKVKKSYVYQNSQRIINIANDDLENLNTIKLLLSVF